jgi:hypothetical protein
MITVSFVRIALFLVPCLTGYLVLVDEQDDATQAISDDTLAHHRPPNARSTRSISLLQTHQATVKTMVLEGSSEDTSMSSHPDAEPVQSTALMETGHQTVRKVVNIVEDVIYANASASEEVARNVHRTKPSELHWTVQRLLHGDSVEWIQTKENLMVRLRRIPEQVSWLARGLTENPATVVPARTGWQLMTVFIVVFGIVGMSWMMYLLRNMCAAGEAFQRHRLLTLCLSLSACSWGMTVANKYLMMKLLAPGFVLAVQMAMAVVASIFIAGGRLSLESGQVKRWMIVPALACVQLWTSLYTMKHLTLSMLMIIRNLGPLVALPCEMLVMPASKRPAVTYTSVFALLLVLSSAATYIGGAPPSLKGCAFAFLNMFLAVVDVVLRRRLLTTECAEMNTSMCMLLNNFVGIVPSILLCFCTGELLDIDLKSAFSTYTIAVLLISGLIGSGISYFALNVQREMAATSFMVLENGIRLAEVLAGVLLFKDPFEWPSQILGLIVSYVGSVVYAKVQIDDSVPTKSAYECKPAGATSS